MSSNLYHTFLVGVIIPIDQIIQTKKSTRVSPNCRCYNPIDRPAKYCSECGCKVNSDVSYETEMKLFLPAYFGLLNITKEDQEEEDFCINLVLEDLNGVAPHTIEFCSEHELCLGVPLEHFCGKDETLDGEHSYFKHHQFMIDLFKEHNLPFTGKDIRIHTYSTYF